MYYLRYKNTNWMGQGSGAAFDSVWDDPSFSKATAFDDGWAKILSDGSEDIRIATDDEVFTAVDDEQNEIYKTIETLRKRRRALIGLMDILESKGAKKILKEES